MGQVDAVVRGGTLVGASAAPAAAPGEYTFDCRTAFDRAPAWQELLGMRSARKLVAIRDAGFRSRLIEEADRVGAEVDPDALVIAGPSPGGAGEGSTLGDEARRRGISPAAAYLELVLETGGAIRLVLDERR